MVIYFVCLAPVRLWSPARRFCTTWMASCKGPIADLPRVQCTTGNKIGYLCIPEILVITWSYTLPCAPQVYQCIITQSTGMATQMHHGVFLREIAWPPGYFREKKQQQGQVRLNKNVFTDMDNRARATALDKKTKKANLVGRKTLKLAVRKWEMLVASKVKMSSSEKKRTGIQATKLLVYTDMYNISFIRCVTREFHVVVAVQNNVKKMYEKKCAAK